MPRIRQGRQSRIGGGELLRGDAIDWHEHPFDQFVYPASGVISALTEAQTYVLPSAGRGLYLPAGVRHAHRAHRRTRLHTLLLPTDHPHPAGARPDDPRRPAAGRPGDEPPGRSGADPRRPDGPRVLPVSPLLRELLAALRAPDLGDARRDRLLAVVADELAGDPLPTLALPRPTDPRLAAAADALAADPAGATLTSLATAAAVSARTLTRLVADRLGLTVPYWRSQYRLAASLLLLTDGATVTDTAHRCGWRNASAYIAAFRAAFGTTPATYQRTLPT
jgi:AraC-like DNA-binding protein/quercetin dioxygenase-like cupin family protein